MASIEQHLRDAGATDASLALPISWKQCAGLISILKDGHLVLKARIVDLERKLAEVERKGITYGGTWQRAGEYARGTVTTHKGSAWACVADTTRAEPGGSGDWQLMVKAGQDGRDAR